MPNNDFLPFTTKHDVDEATFFDLWSKHSEVHTYLVGINGTTDALGQRYHGKPKDDNLGRAKVLELDLETTLFNSQCEHLLKYTLIRHQLSNHYPQTCLDQSRRRHLDNTDRFFYSKT